MRRALLALALIACSKPEAAPSPSPVASSSPTSVSVNDLPMPKGPSPVTLRGSALRKEKGLVAECVDVSALVTPPAGASDTWKPAKNPAEEILKGIKGTTIIADSCAALSDRVALATCDVEIGRTETDAGATITVRFFERFYSFAEVGLSDDHMTECLEMKGKWSAVARDSREWRRAKLEHDAANLRKAVQKLDD